ncbi:MAG: hypothetical protein KDA17_04905 [Candidatus Saccharibacteria bacterium]|nr:hypothetical protein [Candidatus Saccharibacteria bacterium]MCA9337003.1 hypothetical protein [Candidatus Saccharibacteria bacterium]MCA9340226.1 hypothetical protein [Candidatus Saccharibacteria bacterium]
MASTTNSTVQKFGAMLRNPRVQQFLAWALPILLGWVLSKLDTKSTSRGKKK